MPASEDGIEVAYASRAAPGVASQDLVVATEHFVVVIDGATPDPGLATGCVHDVSWLVRELGAALCGLLLAAPAPPDPLPDVLAGAIDRVCGGHAETCDLSNPDSPSATVAILRWDRYHVDYLVLGDCAVVLALTDGRLLAVADNRLDRVLAAGTATRSQLRNTEAGFWVASTRPAAASRALTGTHDRALVRRAAVLSDGAYRLADRYGYSWPGLFGVLARAGPERLIALTRRAEADTPEGRLNGKRHDDATAVLCRFGTRVY